MNKQDIQRMKKLLDPKTNDLDTASKDLFRNTSEYEFYLFGIAKGMYEVYKMCQYSISKGYDLNVENILNVIKNSALNTENISLAFSSFIEEKMDK